MRAAVVLASVLLTAPAGAQTPGPSGTGGGAGAAAATAASGQATSPASPTVEELFVQFKQTVKTGDWPRAYELMQQAYGMQQTYDVLGNLGTAEFQLGKYRDAAEHLARSLRQFPAVGDPELKRLAGQLLARVEREVGVLLVKVSPAQAHVYAGGRAYGPGDYRDRIFVEPGEVTVSAGDVVGYASEKRQVTIAKGQEMEVSLTLKSEPGTAGAPAEDGPSPWVIGAGIGLTAVSLGLGIGLVAAAEGKKQEAIVLRDALLTQGNKVCAPGNPPEDCKNFTGARDTAVAFGNVGGSLLIAAGVMGAATLVYFLVERPSSPAPVKAGITVGPDGAAFAIQGSF